ncbi:MAG: hypothetical protein GON13_01315 [Nanoarchaeota archaeon]|nr:hypothetical protein [Nanoarchaeota archaeon]
MTVDLIQLINFTLPTLSILLTLTFIFVFVRKKKKLNTSSKFFILFLLSFLVYAILLGLRSSILDLEIATYLSKISYIFTTSSSMFLFFTAYSLKGMYKKDYIKFIYMAIPTLLIIILLILPNSLMLERHGVGWAVDLSPLFKISYIGILFSYTLLAMYNFRKIFIKLSDKKYIRKIQFLYVSIILMIVSFIFVIIIFMIKPEVPLTLALIPFLINLLFMFLAFVY